LFEGLELFFETRNSKFIVIKMKIETALVLFAASLCLVQAAPQRAEEPIPLLSKTQIWNQMALTVTIMKLQMELKLKKLVP